MISGLAAALLIGMATTPSAYTFLRPDEAEERARACGFTEVSTEYVEIEQSDYVIIADPAATDDQIDCLASTFDATSFFVVVPEAYAEEFQRAAHELSEPRSRAFAREGLTRLGYGDPPPYDPTTMTDAEYAVQLERFCGPEAIGALGSEWGPRVITPTFAISEDHTFDRRKGEMVSCLFFAGYLVGYDLGFIGNEKLRDE